MMERLPKTPRAQKVTGHTVRLLWGCWWCALCITLCLLVALAFWSAVS